VAGCPWNRWPDVHGIAGRITVVRAHESRVLKKSALDAVCGTWFTLCTATAEVHLRGTDETIGLLFCHVDLEARIPINHPLRKIRQMVNEALAGLDAVEDSVLLAD